MEAFPLLLNQSDNLHNDENDYGEVEVDGHHHDEGDEDGDGGFLAPPQPV